MKKCILSLLLALTLSVSAFAMEVPTETVIRNLNGSQQLIKIYILSPDADPQTLIEAPFELEGYTYTFADIVKEENRVADTDRHTETVTLETTTNELSDILEQMAPTMEYDDGLYTGTLALDHTSIRTEASGYTTKSRKVSTTKTIIRPCHGGQGRRDAEPVRCGLAGHWDRRGWRRAGALLLSGGSQLLRQDLLSGRHRVYHHG